MAILFTFNESSNCIKIILISIVYYLKYLVFDLLEMMLYFYFILLKFTFCTLVSFLNDFAYRQFQTFSICLLISGIYQGDHGLLKK